MGIHVISDLYKQLQFIIALLAASFFIAAPARASRQPTVVERKELMHAVSYIRKVGGQDEAVSALRQKISQGAILVEDKWDDQMSGQTNYPVAGTQTITISAKKIPNPSLRIYMGRFGPAAFFEDQTWLASVLVHEWLHTTQSFLYVHTIRWNTEPPAWEEQIRFLKRVASHVEGNVFFSVRAESLVDRAQTTLDFIQGRMHD